MTRLLTSEEIENMLNFIKPGKSIPLDTAMSIVNANKDRFRKQLRGQKVYPSIIPELAKEIEKSYFSSLVQPGESVGVIGAQSIGEKNTQTTLNSVDWTEKLLYTKNGKAEVVPIGQMIDNLLEEASDEEITQIEENRTEYLPLPEGYMVPSCDEHGNCNWYRVEAVTRHLPVGQLVKVTTASGRSVMATQSKSFLVWDGKTFVATPGSDVKVGDIMPTTKNLVKPKETQEYFDLRTILPKDKYLYTTEIKNMIEYQSLHGGLQSRKTDTFKQHNGVEFTVPYNRYDILMGKRKEYFETCEPGLVYIHTSNSFVSHIPEKLLLDNDFGFLVGLYLTEGWCTKTFVGISNNDEVIRKRVTDYCDRYGITYHLVTSQGKNVRQGESNDLKIHSTLLARIFKIICDTGSANKKVPEFAYTAPVEFIKGLIDGYISGDGSINKTDGSVIVSSVSENLITGISFLLSYFDIFGRMSNYQIKKNNVGSKNIKRTYTLCIRNGFAQNFAREIPLTESKKQEKLNTITLVKKYRHIDGKTQDHFPRRDVYFDKVVEVERVDSTDECVYDLTVEHTRMFQMWNGQNLMDTFHKAGMSEKTMNTGMPRFQELLNATKDPHIVNHKIYFTEDNDTIKALRKKVGHSIAGLTIGDLAESITVKLNKEDETWYAAYKVLYDDTFSTIDHCISIKFKKNKLFEFKLTMEDIADFIHSEYGDLHCVFSPPLNGRMDVFVDTTEIELPEDRMLFIDTENAVEIYMDECVQPNIEKMYVCGIPGICEVFYTQDEKTDEWFVETNGTNSKKIASQYSSYKKLLGNPTIDMTRTVSNNVWDIYETLGIEAAREFLVEEFMSIMEGINQCHAELLVDRMTHCGTISSITRYTLRSDEGGPLGRCSFEETMDNFLKAAAQGQFEPTKGVSASIICGKRANIGTGMMDLRMDLSKLPLSDDYIMEEEEEEEEGKEGESDGECIPDFEEE